MNDVNDDVQAYFGAEERGEFRFRMSKATVHRLRELALVESARRQEPVSWQEMLRVAAEEFVQKQVKN